jgi:hypothetical protein
MAIPQMNEEHAQLAAPRRETPLPAPLLRRSKLCPEECAG